MKEISVARYSNEEWFNLSETKKPVSPPRAVWEKARWVVSSVGIAVFYQQYPGFSEGWCV